MNVKEILDDFRHAVAIGDPQWLKELLSEHIPTSIQDITILDLQFCEAAAHKDMVRGPKMMDAFLDAGMPINHISSLGEAPIHNANTAHMLEHLHRLGANLNLPNEFGEGLVHILSVNMIRGFSTYRDTGPAMFETLKRLGANFNLRDKNGDTALHHIIEKSLVRAHTDELLSNMMLTAQALVGSGLDVNARNMQGATALGKVCFACKSSNTANWLQPLIKTLLSAGARFDPESGQYESAIIAAIETDDLEGFRQLTQPGMPGHPLQPWTDFLVHATKLGKAPFVRELLESGYNVDHEKISKVEKKYTQITDPAVQQCLAIIRSHVCAKNASMAIREMGEIGGVDIAGVKAERFGDEASEGETNKNRQGSQSFGGPRVR